MTPALAITAGSTVTLLALLAAHLVLWPYRDQMHRTHAYVVGVSCIGLGMLVASALLDHWMLVIAFVGVALPGGLAILGAWWVRGTHEQPADSIRRRIENARAIHGKPPARDN